MLSLTVFDLVLYFAGLEGIWVMLKASKTSVGAEIIQLALIFSAGVISRIT